VAAAHEPRKAAHVMNRIRDIPRGKDYDSRSAWRMRGAPVNTRISSPSVSILPPQAWVQRFPAADVAQFRPPRITTA